MNDSAGGAHETFMKHPITQPPPSNIPLATAGKSAGPWRRSKFSRDEDLVLLREVAACKAHISPTGETRERFELAASKANATKKLSSTVTWKALQDRYKRLQLRFDENDRETRKMSGLGGEVTEMDELLAVMKEDRTQLMEEKNSRKERERKRDREKERLGTIIRARATERQTGNVDERKRINEQGTNSEVHTESSASGAPKTKRKKIAVADLHEEVAFAKALERSDKARIDLEKEKLELARLQMEDAKKEREMAREERKQEREAAAELELRKMKLMMDTITACLGSTQGSGLGSGTSTREAGRQKGASSSFPS